MVSLHDQRWIINALDDSRAHETINNSLNDSTDTMNKPATVNKISRIIQSLQEQSLWKNLMKCYISSFKKRLKKMTTGKTWVLYSLALIVQEKDNIKSWNGLGPIKINSPLMIVIVFMEPMLILSCLALPCQWKIYALSDRNIFTQAIRWK